MSLPEKLSSLVRGVSTPTLRLPNANALQANRTLIAAGLATAVAVLAGIPLASRTLADYRAWLAIDAGGLPYNFFGYLVNVAMKPFTRSDLRVPAPYDASSPKLQALYGPEAFRSYFSATMTPPPARRGHRPDVPAFAAPQRQTSQMASGSRILERQIAFLAAVAAANPGLVKRAPSAAEGGYHQALWLADELLAPPARKPKWAGLLKGEFAHPHGEGSAHFALSLTDAATLIEKGWAERHPLSGVRGVLPWGFVLVYAPRDEEEFAVWKDVVLASTRFVVAAVAVGGSGSGSGNASAREVVVPKV